MTTNRPTKRFEAYFAKIAQPATCYCTFCSLWRGASPVTIAGQAGHGMAAQAGNLQNTAKIKGIMQPPEDTMKASKIRRAALQDETRARLLIPSSSRGCYPRCWSAAQLPCGRPLVVLFLAQTRCSLRLPLLLQVFVSIIAFGFCC